MKAFLRTAAVIVLAGSALAGCANNQKKGLCPPAVVLTSTSLYSVFKGALPAEPGNVLYSVAVKGVKAECDFDKFEGTTDSSVEITFEATRDVAGTAEEHVVPYYVVVTVDSTTIVSKKVLSVPFSFEPGETTTTFTAEVPSVPVKMDNGKKPYDYGIIVGLQMTQEQLDYNKKMGRYAL